MTMVRVGEMLTDLCRAEKLQVELKYVDLWISDYIHPGTDLVVEMLPYYKGLKIPVVDGKRFLNPREENAMYADLLEIIREMLSQKVGP